MLDTSLLLQATYTRYIFLRGEAVRSALLAPDTAHGDAEKATAAARSRMAHHQMLGALHRHEDETGVDIHDVLLAAVDRQVKIAEDLAKNEAVQLLKLIESTNRSAA